VSHKLRLRTVEQSDLSVFFEHQCDPEANRMAAFIHADPCNRTSFDAHWARILVDQEIWIRTIVIDQGIVVGNVASYVLDERRQVCYWIGRDHWGCGYATEALGLLLESIGTRPLYASAAYDNLASLRVLEKCGFRIVGSEVSLANGRGEELKEVMLMLGCDLAG